VSRKLLILRPEPGASATAARAKSMGLETLVCPLFETRAVEWEAPETRFDAIVFTSANALRLGGAKLSTYCSLPVYAVGDATAEAARTFGFTNVIAGDADVAAVTGKIARAGHRNVLHLAGRDHMPSGFEAIAVYASDVIAPPDIPNAAVALLHSARAARRFAEIVEDRSSVSIVAISSVVADAAGRGWRSVSVADQPRDASMLALAARLCETREE
jgi:uroporphyrinogen-III synthase